jgi:hypothetical protein
MCPLKVFQFLEWPFLLLCKDKRPKLLFVLALPRSGSTLTYQIIVHGLRVQYLSNIWNLFYQLPLLGGWVSKIVNQNHKSDFRSEHGFVPGLAGPAEGLKFWQWWLGADLVEDSDHNEGSAVNKSRLHYIRRVFTRLTRSNNGPFVSAYLGHTLVPERLSDAFPEALIIRVRRDPVDNALSLLNSMRQGSGNWFSVLPKECRKWDKASEYERVAAQVYWLNKRLDEASLSSGYLEVHYEALCQNPTAELNRIHDFCLVNDVVVEKKYSLPEESFRYKHANIEVDEDAKAIACALKQLESEYGLLKSCD